MGFNLKGLILSLTILSILYDYTYALRCFKCDSTNQRDCAVNPGNSADLEIVMCKDDDDDVLCAMSIVGQITYRDCSDVIPKREGDYYQECDTNLCNDKIWPPGRLKCFQCEGEDCVQEQSVKTNYKPCTAFLDDDLCYTDVLNENNTIRGCKSDNKTLSPDVVECTYNACNNQNGIQKRVCLQCNDEKTGCKRIIPSPDPTKCFLNETLISNCTVQYLFGRPIETCFIYHRLNKVERGCTKLRPDISNDVEHFSKCNDTKCNNKCLNATKCVVCDSSEDENCKNNPKSIKLTECGPEQSSCYTKITNINKDIIKRGCGAPFDLNNTYLCQGDGCNIKEVQKCYSCSSKNDSNCSKWTNLNAITDEICETPDDECLTVITDDQATVRGCKSQHLYCNENNATIIACKNCTGNLCNTGIFPESRLKCYECQNSESCNRDQRSNGVPSVCTHFTSTDECIEFLDPKEEKMIRGCKSDINFYEICKKQDDKCIKCNSEGCNYHKVYEKPQLSCFTCNDTEIPKGACAWKQKNDKLAKCKNNVMFYNEETCFAYTDTNGENISRGCTLDFNITNLCQSENDNKTNCQICNTEGCNYINLINQTCVQCQSNFTGMENCKNKVESIKPTICQHPNQYFDKRGCFIKTLSKEVVQRGCSFNLTDEDFIECAKPDGKNCVYCSGNNCNKVEAPEFFGSSSKPTVTLWCLIIITGVMIFF